MLTLNRYILLDPPLLFFISGAIYTSVKFHNQRDRAFSASWWFWLSTIGVMLAGAVGVKFVGLFVVIAVGFRAISDLWDILGDLSKPVVRTALITANMTQILLTLTFSRIRFTPSSTSWLELCALSPYLWAFTWVSTTFTFVFCTCLDLETVSLHLPSRLRSLAIICTMLALREVRTQC